MTKEPGAGCHFFTYFSRYPTITLFINEGKRDGYNGYNMLNHDIICYNMLEYII
jgi:hypothetical protein